METNTNNYNYDNEFQYIQKLYPNLLSEFGFINIENLHNSIVLDLNKDKKYKLTEKKEKYIYIFKSIIRFEKFIYNNQNKEVNFNEIEVF